MDIAIIGLGRMGFNMGKRLIEGGHRVIGFDRSKESCRQFSEANGTAIASLGDLKKLQKTPRIAWVMVPHGSPTDAVINDLADLFEENDIIIDGGNSHFAESIAHAELLKKRGIHFVDVGVSGGIFGLTEGYCLMVGGDKEIFLKLEPIFLTLAPKENSAAPSKSRSQAYSSAHRGYYHCGRNGAGHYVKMVHNAIEYSMMQSYAEGVDLLFNASSSSIAEHESFDFDVREITELWRRGSVIRSWLLDLLTDALHKNPDLSEFKGSVGDSGEGRWALIEAIKQGTSVPSLASALFTRFRSQKEQPMSERALSALRKEFGGHKEGVGPKNDQ